MDDEWKEVKNNHNLDIIIFSTLNTEFNHDFYN
jgi:hypothetical protein